MPNTNNQSIVAVIKRYSLAFLPSFVWASVIYLLSNQEVLPGLSLSIPDFILKKTAHITVYAVLYFLTLYGFAKIDRQPQESWRAVMAICLFYAIVDELHQTMVPGRSGTLRDVWFDCVGIGLAFLGKFGYI